MRRSFALFALAVALPAQAPELPPDVIDRFARMAVQEDGRVKPLSTLASFSLLRMHGSRRLSAGDGRITPAEWVVDLLFRPQLVHELTVFRVDNDEVVDAIGVAHGGKRKRDRYSYRELMPQRERLFTLGRAYHRIERQDRSPVQEQVVRLASNVMQYEGLAEQFDFARARLAIPAESPRLREMFGGAAEVPFSAAAAELHSLVDLYHAVAPAGREPTADERAEQQRIETLVERIGELANRASALSWIPPQELERAAWMTVQDVVAEPAGPARDQRLELVAGIERLAAAAADPAEFDRRSAELLGRLQALAAARGEYAKIDLEVFFYRLDPFTYALGFYLLAFVVCMLAGLRPRSRWLWRGAWVLTVLPTILLVVGIVIRCVLRERPPVSTLYETILFITACIALVAFAIEAIGRRRLALTTAAFLGAVGMFIARKHEEVEGVDTMPTLLAVLDTNFWLASHVTTVTLGYAAGLLAAALAHVYLLGKLFGWRRGDAPLYRAIARMVYGVIAFGLLFSLVGTILGGVWANDSWGRFWGWDPKENGALMICLWELAMLHGRMGGYLKDHGFCIAAVFGAIIVAFSWWGVNLLGIGLHSYGFTSGIALSLYGFYGLELIVLGLGGLAWLRERRRAAAPPAGAIAQPG
jgi:ABC-type transport system involved in cytochrome c biogenesis permease subunit